MIFQRIYNSAFNFNDFNRSLTNCFNCIDSGEDWESWRNSLIEFGLYNKKLQVKPGTTLNFNKNKSTENAPTATLYGKLNFKNQAKKDVKIYELSGIGEPTVLSPNYVSTFFVKSSKPSASFKAEDPNTHEEYLMNGKNIFKFELSQNPMLEDDVVITEDIPTKRTPDQQGKLSRI